MSLPAMRHVIRIELGLKLALPEFGRLLPNSDTWQVPASHFRGVLLSSCLRSVAWTARRPTVFP
jgi:hypothetical protein